jgi:hypothetical protein
MFSKMTKWLAEVDGKSGENAAPSGTGLATRLRAGCALWNENSCSTTAFSDCPCFWPLSSGKKDLKLVKQLLRMAKSVLTDRQKSLLVSAVQELRWNSMTLTRLCGKLSCEMKMSYSTVKWNVRRLTTMKLLLGGTETSKGVEARPTTLGCLMASMLAGSADSLRYDAL